MANYRVLSVLTLLFSSVSSLASVSSQAIPAGYYQVAVQERVPAEALYSLALTESSKKLPHGVRPWPWTINVAGTGYRYATRQEAYQALLGFMRSHSLKRIDVGIAQVNLGWNGHHFRSSWEAFDPYVNLHVAARILRACYDNKPGSWIAAAGCYHHPAGGQPARTYQAIVTRHLNRLQPATGVLASHVVIEPSAGVTP
ncbi:lytic transglycosylase [Chania multitudinisentens RB-25]|uniref:Lytic transglycosylase n=1 Tax=Chania multitudinisentens RB-25 TaxID=1441930 RepID=W0LA76_9GAMM|nr:transglycosylase SLT domain-containing protein [Chania multitudinisentens]AHG20631.1 lytic transglycosylase [Chania multitudinisentens RB-25]